MFRTYLLCNFFFPWSKEPYLEVFYTYPEIPCMDRLLMLVCVIKSVQLLLSDLDTLTSFSVKMRRFLSHSETLYCERYQQLSYWQLAQDSAFGNRFFTNLTLSGASARKPQLLFSLECIRKPRRNTFWSHPYLLPWAEIPPSHAANANVYSVSILA